MKFVTIDNDETRLDSLRELLINKYPNCTVTEFTDPMLSAKYICNNEVDIVFAQKLMNRVNGEALKHAILVNKPYVRVVLFEEIDKTTDLEQLLSSI